MSLQRFSRCSSVTLENVKPWLGHGKTKKRLQVRARPKSTEEEDHDGSNPSATNSDHHANPVTRRGTQESEEASTIPDQPLQLP